MMRSITHKTNCRLTLHANNDRQMTALPNAETPKSYKSTPLAIQYISSLFCNLMVCYMQLLNISGYPR